MVTITSRCWAASVAVFVLSVSPAEAAALSPPQGLLGQGGNLVVPSLWASGFALNSHRQFVADVNGDGRADAIDFQGPNSGDWWVALASASSFSAGSRWTSGFGCGSYAQFVADVDGDGRADLIDFQGPNSGDWWVALSSGSGFRAGSRWASGFGRGSHTQFVADVNGDGKADLIDFQGPGSGDWWVALSTGSGFQAGSRWATGFALGSHAQFVADVNGDGKADLIDFQGPMSGFWFVSLSSGPGFEPYQNWATGLGLESTLQMVADFDGNGRADVAVNLPGTAFFTKAMSTGHAFRNPTTIQGVGGYRVFVADVDGDGAADQVGYSAARGQWAVLTSPRPTEAARWIVPGQVTRLRDGHHYDTPRLVADWSTSLGDASTGVYGDMGAYLERTAADVAGVHAYLDTAREIKAGAYAHGTLLLFGQTIRLIHGEASASLRDGALSTSTQSGVELVTAFQHALTAQTDIDVDLGGQTILDEHHSETLEVDRQIAGGGIGGSVRIPLGAGFVVNLGVRASTELDAAMAMPISTSGFTVGTTGFIHHNTRCNAVAALGWWGGGVLAAEVGGEINLYVGGIKPRVELGLDRFGPVGQFAVHIYPIDLSLSAFARVRVQVPILGEVTKSFTHQFGRWTFGGEADRTLWTFGSR